jgi:hypothetical protein
MSAFPGKKITVSPEKKEAYSPESEVDTQNDFGAAGTAKRSLVGVDSKKSKRLS